MNGIQKTKKMDRRQGRAPQLKWQQILPFIWLLGILRMSDAMSGFLYVFVLTGLLLFAFFLFTRSIQERFLWLIVFLPLTMSPVYVYHFYVSPFEAITALLCVEIIFKKKYLRFRRVAEHYVTVMMFIPVVFNIFFAPIRPGIGQVIRFGSILFLFYTGRNILDFRHPEHVRQTLRAFGIMFLGLLIYFYTTHSIIDPNIISNYRLVGSHFFVYAFGLAFPGVFVFLHNKRKFFSLLFMAIIVLFIVLCGSQTGYLVLICDLLYLAVSWANPRRIFSFLALVLLSIVFLLGIMKFYQKTGEKILHPSGNQLRFVKMVSIMKTTKHYPLTGVGISEIGRRGSLGFYSHDYMWRDKSGQLYSGGSPENAFIQLFAEMGFLGILPPLFLVGYYIVTLTRKNIILQKGKRGLPLYREMAFINWMFGLILFNWLVMHFIRSSYDALFWIALLIVGLWTGTKIPRISTLKMNVI